MGSLSSDWLIRAIALGHITNDGSGTNQREGPTRWLRAPDWKTEWTEASVGSCADCRNR